jgi:hypothetical protein
MKFAFIHRAIVKERRESIEWRKMWLIRLLAKASVGLHVSDHIVEPGDVVFTTLVSSTSKASYRSALAHLTAPGGHGIGSRRRTRRHRR